MMSTEELVPGTWFVIRRGTCYNLYCVLAREKARVFLISSPLWLVSSAEWVTKEEIINGDFIFLGKTSKKWFWKFLPWRNLVFPYYQLKF